MLPDKKAELRDRKVMNNCWFFIHVLGIKDSMRIRASIGLSSIEIAEAFSLNERGVKDVS